MNQESTHSGKGGSKALWVGVAIIAIAAASVVGAKSFYQSKVREFVARGGATAKSIEVDFLGQVHLRELTVPLQNGKNIRIAAVDGRPKLPFIDGALTLSDIDIDVPTGKILMGQARIENAEFKKLEAVPGEANTLSRRIEAFAATRISTREVTFTQSIATTEQKTVYKDVEFSDLADGHIASYSSDMGSYDIKVSLPDGEGVIKEKHILVSTGAIAGQDFDIAYLARLYTEKAGPDDKEPKPLYGPLSVKNISFTEGEGRFSYDEIRSDGFTARMPAEPLIDTLNALTTPKNTEELSPQERQALVAKALSILDMIGRSNIELLGLKAEGSDESTGSVGKRVNVAVNRLEMQMDNRKLDFGLHGMSFGRGTDKVDVAEVSLKGFDWGSTLEGLTQIVGLDETQIGSFPFNRLIPELGILRVGGINVDVATPEKAGEQATGAPERIKFALKNFEMGLTKPFNGIPTDIEIKQDELTLPIPADSTEEAFIEARKLGLESFTMSYALSAAWDQPNTNLMIRQISLSGKDFGSINVSGLISGFTEEFFAFDAGRAQAALFGLAGRELKLTIKDEGLMAKAIKLYALQNEITEEQVRGTLALVVNVVLQQFAAEQPKLKSATDALLQFINRPGTLTVTVKFSQPNGFGIFDLIAASDDPMILLDKVDIQATAE